MRILLIGGNMKIANNMDLGKFSSNRMMHIAILTILYSKDNLKKGKSLARELYFMDGQIKKK